MSEGERAPRPPGMYCVLRQTGHRVVRPAANVVFTSLERAMDWCEVMNWRGADGARPGGLDFPELVDNLHLYGDLDPGESPCLPAWHGAIVD